MFGVSEPFWMHDATRRWLCLGLFLLGGVLPTVGVLGWVAWRTSPWRLQEQIAQLERTLGFSVRLEGIQHPQPTKSIYEGIQLLDPETGQEILRAARVQVRWAPPTAPSRACVGMAELSVQGLEIRSEGLDRLAELVRRALTQPAYWPPYEVRIQCAEARLRQGRQMRTLSELNGFLQPLEAGSHGRLSFRLDAGQPIQIRFGRDHFQSPPVSGLELAAENGPLPCSLLAEVFPGLTRLGPTASLRGTLWICQQQGQVEYRFQGQLFQVDLKTVLGGEFGPMLSGFARLQVDQARIVGGRLEEAVGSLSAGPGVISRRLWQSAVRELGLVTGFTPGADEESLSYEQLGVAFRIGPEGLLIRGVCPAPAPGSIMVNSHQLLLGEGAPTGGAIPIAALVRMLVGQETIPPPLQAPATRQAEQLLRLLPLPLGEGETSGPPALAETASRNTAQ